MPKDITLSDPIRSDTEYGCAVGQINPATGGRILMAGHYVIVEHDEDKGRVNISLQIGHERLEFYSDGSRGVSWLCSWLADTITIYREIYAQQGTVNA